MKATATIGIVVFPGTNCERDVEEAVELAGAKSRLIWHTDSDLSDIDGIVIPGGFAHGDYLRPGAIARFSPIMNSIIERARKGMGVLGICNGFQILTEAGLLPGALQKNAGLTFLCDVVKVRVETTNSPLTSGTDKASILRLPINHFEGNYICSDHDFEKLLENDRVILRYENNPNGSLDDIAGIVNEAGNVVGLMPHPERATRELLGSSDGLRLLESYVSYCRHA